jgi:POT family proton-dependent oligopeptide transporter
MGGRVGLTNRSQVGLLADVTHSAAGHRSAPKELANAHHTLLSTALARPWYVLLEQLGQYRLRETSCSSPPFCAPHEEPVPMTTRESISPPTLFGHPTGLFTLFFAEMWERFSYYGMRALLLLYMLKGFLKYDDGAAYAVYGAYTALVYMTPFLGGLLADKILGSRRAVIWGGLLMAAGHALMGLEQEWAFFGALALLITGNGFFKPNISTIVGFYMGINLGAAMSPLLCGYIGETYGWHRGFGLATIGMLVGIAVFVAPTRVSQILIGLGTIGSAYLLLFEHPDNWYYTAVNLFVMISLLGAGVVAILALDRGNLPADVGTPPSADGVRRHQLTVYVGTLLSLPVFTLLVSGFAPLTSTGQPLSLIPDATLEGLKGSSHGAVQVLAVFVQEISRPAGLVLIVAGILALIYLIREMITLERVPRERMYVAFMLIFFSMLFWSFFEQAGSSINNFTDRNVSRVFYSRQVEPSDIGKTLEIQPTQAQLGYENDTQIFSMSKLSALRDAAKEDPDFTIKWIVVPSNVGMAIAERSDEIPASTFQSVNPVFILIFGLLFSFFWTLLGRYEPTAPFKFALGLLQLGMGFGMLWYGALLADERGMVGLEWLIIAYLLQTTGELCVSPVGLSMMTRLAPARLAATVMGTWFLATAFSQYLAAIISQFTGITPEGDGAERIPAPIETVAIYGNVFGKIALWAMLSSLACFVLVPLMKKWMHLDKPPTNHEAV